MRRLAVAAAAALLVMSGTSARAAPTLSTPLACLNSTGPLNQTFAVYGTGFPPNIPVYVGVAGDPYTWYNTVRTDADGNLSTEIWGSIHWGDFPTIATLQAFEPSLEQRQPPPQLLASTQVPAVQEGLDITPNRGFVGLRANFTLTWGGFPHPGATIYAHYYFTHNPWRRWRYLRTFRLGQLTGPCAGLKVSFPILERMHPKTGFWGLITDTSRRRPRGHPIFWFYVERFNGVGGAPIPHARRGTWMISLL